MGNIFVPVAPIEDAKPPAFILQLGTPVWIRKPDLSDKLKMGGLRWESILKKKELIRYPTHTTFKL